MGFYATETCSAVGDLPSKNRVVGSRHLAANRIGQSPPQPLETTSETNVAVTIIVSGLPSWLNRDPIGERGGRNLYLFVRNSSPNMVDTDGREPVITGTVGLVALGAGLLLTDALIETEKEWRKRAAKYQKKAMEDLECGVILWMGHNTTGGGIKTQLTERKDRFADNRCIRHAVYGCEVASDLLKGDVIPKERFVLNHPQVAWKLGKGERQDWTLAEDIGQKHIETVRGLDSGDIKTIAPESASYKQVNIATYSAVYRAAKEEALYMSLGDNLPCECECTEIKLVVVPVFGFELFYPEVKEKAYYAMRYPVVYQVRRQEQ